VGTAVPVSGWAEALNEAMTGGVCHALREEKVFLRTFVAGQKYVGWRDETRRF
jgi:hypothetical protein